jgi:cyclohexyl-isocyanide hydratase
MTTATHPGDATAGAPIHVGALLFPRVDQLDFTGPFEVLSRLPGATFHVLGKEKAPVRDGR